MDGTVPASLGQLISLNELYLGYDDDSNKFSGQLPSSMSSLVLLSTLYLNVPTLGGPMPDFSRLTRLEDCAFVPSHMCSIPEFVPINSQCNFTVVPVCMAIPDCVLLADWLPTMFDQYYCCQVDGVTCEEDRVVILDLSKGKTRKNIFGGIPIAIGELDKLVEIYLQNNFLEGNLPISMSNISSLQIVDITNNYLSGVIQFLPTFQLIGIDSNFGLTLPSSSTPIDPSMETTKIIYPTDETDDSKAAQEDSSSDSESPIADMLIGVSAAVLLVIPLIIAFVILFKRRKQGKETEIELKLPPKYSSPNQQIRMMRKINSGGFGVVWEARYKGETVALKLIRTDLFKGRECDLERNVKTVKMVIDEASIMGLMVHKRIVRFIMFEIESLGIVLEYLPLGSLDKFIRNSKGCIPWTDRYQMMLDICEGMEFLHSKVYADGSKKQVLFHQDLKSGNVLLCMEGNKLRGKISDFGLSCKFLITLTFEFSPERQPYKKD
jgi:hypothetical protein